MPNEICPTIINMIDEIKEKISNAEYKKICDELKVIHEKQKVEETEYYKLEYELIDILIHSHHHECDCCGGDDVVITDNVTYISNPLIMCVPCMRRPFWDSSDEDDKLDNCYAILMKILKDGYLHKCNTSKANNYLVGRDYDITPGNCGNTLHKSRIAYPSDGFSMRKIFRVTGFCKIN